MFQIILKKHIPAPKNIVWNVICNTEDYPKWNKFVVACQSTFEEGTPIVMKVRVLPAFAMRQKETVFRNIKGEFLEYGIKLPFGLLSSSRQHILTEIDFNNTQYESVFILQGLLAPLVGMLLGKQLNRGFNDMTNGIVERSKKMNPLKIV